MNKKIFVVSDTNREYTERFIRCLEAWEGSRFEIRGFTEKECLSEQLAARPADILLISEAMLGMDPEFRGAAGSIQPPDAGAVPSRVAEGARNILCTAISRWTGF